MIIVVSNVVCGKTRLRGPSDAENELETCKYIEKEMTLNVNLVFVSQNCFIYLTLTPFVLRLCIQCIVFL